jgi:hypothetical protein
MVSKGIKKTFDKLFYNFHQDLTASEIFKEILYQHSEFNSSLIFQFLDRGHKNLIDEFDIYALFK